MSKYNISAQDIINYIAAYDTDGQSSTEIDTKQEFDMLGTYLNGNNALLINNDNGFEMSESVDLEEKDTNILLKIIDGLKPKFGDWKYSFDKKIQLTEENICDYANRYYQLCLKLRNGEIDEKSKKDLKDIESKLKKYTKLQKLPIEISSEQSSELVYKFKRYTKELDIKQFLDNTGNEVTSDNVRQYLDCYKYLNNEYEKLPALGMTQDEITVAIEKLKKKLVDYISQNDKALSGKLTVDNIEEYNVSYIVDNIIRKQQKINNDIIPNGNIVKEQINNPYDNKKLAVVVENYIKDKNVGEISDIPENVDIGNGIFDKTSTQKTNNCWAQEGLNSLLTTLEGRQLIENNYYRDEKTGVMAVHLKEAEDFGLHDGIFIVTPEEIVEAQDTISAGEGDITAYMIALKKYFDEVKSHPEINDKRMFLEYDEGNAGFRFFEIMTGAQYYEYKLSDDIDIQDGIGTGTTFVIDNEQLYDLVANKKGAVVISLKGAEHGISIVGVKDGKYLIQESNNDEHYFDKHVDENNEKLFLLTDSVNGRPTFVIDQEKLHKYNLGAISFIKWK